MKIGVTIPQAVVKAYQLQVYMIQHIDEALRYRKR